MLQRIRDRVQSEEGGFTLIELLVVVLIIGVLSAIAIPAFVNQRQKGHDASAKTLARSAHTALETCAVDNAGNYTNCSKATLQGIEPSLNDSRLAVTGIGSGTFTITVTSSSSKTATIVKSGPTSVPVRGGTVGSW